MLVDKKPMGGLGQRIGAAEAMSALGWWLDAGVDAAVQDSPRDWLKGETPPPPAEAPDDAAPGIAIPETLDLFRDWLGRSETLPLSSAATRRVMPRGGENAPIMLLADSPSGDDAAGGQPISGDAWALTERMLAAIGIESDQAYCANISCFHAPGRRMSADELESCAVIARRHIALVKPKLLLLLGDGPARALFGKPVAAARGHVHKIEGVRTVVTFHPRFLLSQPSEKARAWQDLLLLTEESR